MLLLAAGALVLFPAGLLAVVLYCRIQRTPLSPRVDEPWALRAGMLWKDITMLAPIRTAQLFGRDDLACRLLLLPLKMMRLLRRGGSPAPSDQVGIFGWAYAGVPVRVYVPNPDLRATASVADGSIIFLHGGGWVLGESKGYDKPLSGLVERTGLTVVSIDYRLAPAHRFPAAVDDCMAAVRFHLEQGAAALGLDPGRTAIMGDSAGGNLAAVLCHKLKSHTQLPNLKACVLLYPVIQCVNLRLPSYLEEQATENSILPAEIMNVMHLEYFGIPVTRAALEAMRRNGHVSARVAQHPAYACLTGASLPDHVLMGQRPAQQWSPDTDASSSQLGVAFERVLLNPDYSPLLADDFDGLPPTFVATCGFDVLRDEGILYAQRLERAGVDTKWAHYDGTFHGAFSFVPTRLGRQMVADLADFVREKIAA